MVMFAPGSQALFCAPSSAVLKHLIPKLGFFPLLSKCRAQFFGILNGEATIFSAILDECGRVRTVGRLTD